MNNQIDVISIGDIVTDAFIKLIDSEATISDSEGKQLITMEFGTKLPYDHAEIIEAVGNSANAAVAFARLGLNSSFVANVGDDSHGRDMIASLEKNKVDTRFVKINSGMASNYHYVLWYKEERTILVKHEDYPYHWPLITEAETPKWVYFSSISHKALDFHDRVSDWLDKNPSVKMAFQPGTFQMEFGVERLRRIYEKTEVLILNREEAVLVSGGNHEDMNDLFNRLHQLGPKIVVITDGPHGAYASNGNERYQMPLYPDRAAPKDRTGAGDAFASTFVAALIKGNSIEGALQWAPINSMNVLQYTGAQEGLLSEEEITKYLRESPDWYRPSRLS